MSVTDTELQALERRWFLGQKDIRSLCQALREARAREQHLLQMLEDERNRHYLRGLLRTIVPDIKAKVRNRYLGKALFRVTPSEIEAFAGSELQKYAQERGLSEDLKGVHFTCTIFAGEALLRFMHPSHGVF